MYAIETPDFKHIDEYLRWKLEVQGSLVDVGEWQSIRRSERDLPQQRTIELQNVVFEIPILPTMKELQEDVKPNLPFAEAQFQDRVSGQPLNPPPSDELWPWSHHLGDDKATGQYSHTYPERFWPKHAGERQGALDEWDQSAPQQFHRVGIRYAYGDLNDVVSQLAASPYTRQAYLPVWFPEDTGAVHGERVPCSLGYHFLLREGKLSITYFIRSVDYYRHFPDDVYMAARLCQWIAEKVPCSCDRGDTTPLNCWSCDQDPIKLGTLTMHICSLHVFEAEKKRLEKPRRV